MDMVTVGNPGNAADTEVMQDPGNIEGDFTTGYGSVCYSYQIGKYEVTGSQYAVFLNAVASTDTYGLYHPEMETNNRAAQISRSGSPGSYTYAVVGSGDLPIAAVSWWNCARFCNWLSNCGTQNPTMTEDGAYAIPDGRIDTAYIPANAINPNTGLPPTSRLPTENEWYKAAYYDPTKSGGAGYWDYAAQTDVKADATISANPLPGNAPKVVDVGTKNPSYYGTYDQSGNVWEYIEPEASTVFSSMDNPNLIICRGGRYWDNNTGGSEAAPRYVGKGNSRLDTNTNDYDVTQGFRVAAGAIDICLTATFDNGTYGYDDSGSCVPVLPGIEDFFTIVPIVTFTTSGLESYTYSLDGGLGDTDNANFNIISNELYFNENVMLTAGDEFSVRVRAIGDGGTNLYKVVTFSACGSSSSSSAP